MTRHPTLATLTSLTMGSLAWRPGYVMAGETGPRPGTPHPIPSRLLPHGWRDWAEAVLAEAGEIPAGVARLAWLSGGLLLVARVAMRMMRVLAFAAGAACLAWAGWPGGSSDSAVPLNRV